MLASDAPRLSPPGDGLAYGYIGGKVNLSCTAQAVPLVNFMWYRDAKAIEPEDMKKQKYKHRRFGVSNNRVESIGRNANNQRYNDRGNYGQPKKTSQLQDESEQGNLRYNVITVGNTTYLEVRKLRQIYQ